MGEITTREIQERKREYANYGFDDEGDRMPFLGSSCEVGARVRHWGLPNRKPMTLIGFRSDRSPVCVDRCGRVQTFVPGCWFAVIDHSNELRREICEEVFDKVILAEIATQAVWIR